MFTLANLTFQDVIRFYPSNNDAVYKDLKDALLGGHLTPFVGAGLSVFCGYKLWPDVLTELSEFIPDDIPKAEAQEMIRENRHLEAAEHIHKYYSPMMRRLLGIVSYDKIDSCSDERLYSSAAWILPRLFGNRPLMTTNFDGVLEHVFAKQNCAFERVVEPHDPSLLTQIRQKDTHGLFKLHGDIGRETTSMDRLVFTQSQYDEVYCEGGELIGELKQWYQNQTLLFLGCSLAMDKTMKVLHDVASKDPGIRHFAIVGCKAEQRSEFLERFGKLGIDAIFYDDNNHDAVRVILERLLEETDQTAYQQLLRTARTAPVIPKEERSLLFDSEFFPFSGREDELAQLEGFCTAEEHVLWWAITGPGGIGKSRLVFEFCKRKQAEGWQSQRFEAHPSHGSNARCLDELSDWVPAIVKTIVVLDDVQAHIEAVHSWLKKMSRIPRSESLRILLLERDGKDLDSASWLGIDPCGDGLEEWCYIEKFLHLNSMTDEQLMTLMNNYAEASKKKLNASNLLKILERVDPEFKRPLYALAIADARCQGKDPTNWDRTKILDALLKREIEFHVSRFQGMGMRKVSKTLQAELILLLTNICIHGFIPLEKVDWSQYKTLHKRMEDADMEQEEFFERLGILQSAEFRSYKLDQHGNRINGSMQEGISKILTLSCPDLLKEHLVLNQAFERKNLELLPEDWQHDPGRLLFLRKLWVDYPDRLKNQTQFWNRFFQVSSPTGLAARLYGELLWGCTEVFCDLSQQAVDVLTELYKNNDNDEKVAICYAAGLNNFSFNQKLEDIAISASQMDALYQKHSNCQQLAMMYANELTNLSYKQSLAAQSPVILLETLSISGAVLKKHSSLTDIQISHAKTWFNLTLVQKDEDIPATVAKIVVFLQEHPSAIPEFKEALGEYLSKHPDHVERYQLLLEL